tara:strand:- start:8825 stop:9313 length:489 start_codon:yes stop_codon:yes gene_type:complete
MIFDTVENATCYFSSSWWDRVNAFVVDVAPTLPDGEHPIIGEEMFARIMTCFTGCRDDAILESHRTYIDIHIVLEGEEAIAVWPIKTLVPRTGYDNERDVIFYEPPADSAAEIILKPGLFAGFFQQDAHMPQLISGTACQIKKLVIKATLGCMILGEKGFSL